MGTYVVYEYRSGNGFESRDGFSYLAEYNTFEEAKDHADHHFEQIEGLGTSSTGSRVGSVTVETMYPGRMDRPYKVLYRLPKG